MTEVLNRGFWELVVVENFKLDLELKDLNYLFLLLGNWQGCCVYLLDSSLEWQFNLQYALWNRAGGEET